MSAIGDLFLRLIADGTGFEADVVKKAQAAGDKAGLTMGQRMGKGLSAGLTVLGAAGGGLIGIAAKGANDLTNAMAGFRAETGATQAEIDSARKSVLELSKSNLQGFDEIARTQAKLRTDLGLTQAEAEKATATFLKYGTATGRDAAEGVSALDDILDAYNLSADKSGEIMDRLIASHQKFGGSISDDEAALNTLAPAFVSLGMSAEDAQSWINLFNASGVDATSTAAGFNKSLKNIKSPQEFQRLVADITSTEDPLLRAQKAADLFGAKAGPKLANALAGKEIGEFALGMDEVAGSTTKAADAIESTPFNQLKMALQTIAAPAIEAGQAFGPLILALTQLGGGKLVAGVAAALGGLGGKLVGSLGPKLASALGLSFGKAAASKAVEEGAGEVASLTSKQIAKRLAGKAASDAIGGGIGDAVSGAAKSSKLGGALGKLGGFMGSKLGKGLSVAFAAVAVVEVVNTYNEIRDGLNEQSKQIGVDVGNQIASGTIDQLKQSKGALEQGVKQLGDQWFNPFAGEQKDKLQAQLDAVNAELAKRAAQIPVGISNAMARGEHAVNEAAHTMVRPIEGAMDDARKEAARSAGKTPSEIADALTERKSKIDAAMDELRKAITNPMERAKERSRVLGLLTGDELQKALKSKNPAIRAQAEETRGLLEEQLTALVNSSGKNGKKFADNLNAALKSKNPAVRAEAERIKNIIEDRIEAAKPKPNVADGINTAENRKKLIAAVTGVIAFINKLFVNHPVNVPVHTTTLAPKARAAGGPVTAGQAYIVGEHRPELFVPSASGRIVPSVQSGLAAMGAGETHYNIPIHVDGALPVRTVRDIAGEMRRIGDLHLLPSQRAPLYPVAE